MRKSSATARTVGALAAVVLAAGCGGSDGSPDPTDPTDPVVDEDWTASLTNGAVVGANPQTGASGSATLEWNGTRLSWTINVNNMTNVIQAHIHGPATREQNAPVRMWLFRPDQPTGTVNGQLVSGSATSATADMEGGATLAQVLSWMRSDEAHVMVHTTTFPDGEIRGHLVED
ncbi:MAG: CHRD domain-containing protein [Gemmatimonadota bacterium]